ncbi:MAG: hypothetical protein J5528_06755 [Firmicutes bacterium]|nr:hypothetical protein [Bacillota bacterium]
MITVIKAVLFTVLGIVLIIIDERFAKRASQETQEYYTDSMREAYLKDGVRRVLMGYWGYMTVLGVILIILGAGSIVKLIFGIDIVAWIKGLIGL